MTELPKKDSIIIIMIGLLMTAGGILFAFYEFFSLINMTYGIICMIIGIPVALLGYDLYGATKEKPK